MKKRRHQRLRAFNKRFLNPVMLKVAGAAHSPIAAIRHAGRRSGKAYTTPIMMRRTPGGFVIALTYGPEVDWYRNWLAAGQATLLWNGGRYAVEHPEPLPVQTGLQVFSPLQRAILRLNHTHDFLRVRAEGAAGRA